MHKWVILLALTISFTSILINQSNAVPQNSLDILKANFLPAEFVGMNFTADDAKKILKDKCGKVSGNNETVFLEAHKAVLGFMKCVSGLGDLTVIQAEIEIARPIGELDTIFQKYCNKKSQMDLCFNNLMPKIHPCLNNDERSRHSVMVRVASKLFEFVCHQGGNQIALFFAEQGPECLEANKENINNCMNASFADYIPKNGLPDYNNLPQMVLGKKECKDVQDFEKCVLFHLGKCNDITPSNIIESVFKYVKNETQCDPKPKLMALNNRSTGAINKTSFTVNVVLFLFALRNFFVS